MEQHIDELLAALEPNLTHALNQHAKSNDGTFPPFRIPATAREVIADIRTFLEQPESHIPMGTALAQRGLSLTSLLAIGEQLLLLLAAQRNDTTTQFKVGQRYVAQLIHEFVETQHNETWHQRDMMERAYITTLNEQREQESVLRTIIRELAIPIIPVYDGILVLPLIGSIDSTRASELTEQLLMAISKHSAEYIIIDITGVPVIDTSTANNIITTTQAAGLLGSQVVLVGIGAEIAQTIVHLGVNLQSLVTLSNLQAGIQYALARFGLGIQPLAKRGIAPGETHAVPGSTLQAPGKN